MPAACRPAPEEVASPGTDKRRKIEQSPYSPQNAQGGAPPHLPPGSPYYPHPDAYGYPMPPPGHFPMPGMSGPHHQAGAYPPPRPHLPPRYNHHQQFDNSYMAGQSQKQPPSPGDSSNPGAFPSPNTVTTMDSRSPEGSRNDVGNFEERVSSTNGNPPSFSPASASMPPPPYMPPPMGYHPSYPPPHYGHPHYHSPHAPSGWACDYCNSMFPNREECCAHEETCAAKSYYDGKGKNRKPKTYPVDFYMDHNAEYAINDDRETYLLATAKDSESLSDRQCYVRSHFVEVFIANKADMAARHSRGAQKLNENQVGLRCAYCVKLKARDRAERAVCYPSSINRIYQTVADMQRFHFEACVAIPPKVLATYKALKTTRPRGVGSPQGYWDVSARNIGLVDSSSGIQVGENGGMDKLLMQKKGSTGLLESATPTIQSADDMAMPPVLASPGVDGEEQLAPESTAAAASATLPMVSSPGSPGTSAGTASVDADAPSTPVVTDKKVSTAAPVQETREADANILLMLKKTTDSPTEDESEQDVLNKTVAV